MRAQWEPSVLMTDETNEVCPTLYPPPLTQLWRVERSSVGTSLSAVAMTRRRVGGRWLEAEKGFK